MPLRIRLLFMTLNLVLFVSAALPIVRELTRRTDIWWTPRTMLVPLAQGANRVEIYVRDRPLTTLVQSGEIQLVNPGGASHLAPGDIGLRFNNSDRVRAERLPLLLAEAAICGITACFFSFYLAGGLVYRKERTA